MLNNLSQMLLKLLQKNEFKTTETTADLTDSKIANNIT